MRPPACLCRWQSSCSSAQPSYISSGPKRRFLSSKPDPADDVSARLREVMRNVPQPVAIVTARNTSSTSTSSFHGATLTSFTSLTLHPHPLVAFSLRLPSRLADCLRPPYMTASAPCPIPIPPPTPSAPIHPPTKVGPARIPLTVSLLSVRNQPIADALSSRLPDQSAIFSRSEWMSDGTEQPPSLKEAIGALKCEVVSSMPLRDMCENDREGEVGEGEAGASHQLEGSELFICRVLCVDPGSAESEGLEPLLHLKQSYASVGRSTDERGKD